MIEAVAPKLLGGSASEPIIISNHTPTQSNTECFPETKKQKFLFIAPLSASTLFHTKLYLYLSVHLLTAISSKSTKQTIHISAFLFLTLNILDPRKVIL